MREYEVEVNAAQAKNLAMNIAADETSVIWLVKLIDTAFDNVIRQVGAFDRLNNALTQRGYSLNIVPVRERPAKACHPVADKETIGARIKRLRIGKNWSQTELAERIGWTQGTVSMFERNRQTPTTDGLSQLADVFCTSIAVIAGVQTDNTPMTEKMYLDRKHPVVDSRAVKPSKMAAISRRFQEQDEDDDLPSARELQRARKWPPVAETGPQVLAIIQFNSIPMAALRDSYEVTPEEYERIREQKWADFGLRWMHELLTDLTSSYKKEKQREALATDDKHLKPVRLLRPAQMIRSQIVEELNQHFTTHKWLTKEELVANFEMGEDEYDWIVSLNHTKLGVTELRMYLTDIRGAIAERAIEVSQEAK